ncbi:hypothetical protein GCM10007067_14490 [Lysobacter bugurensis]|uniref:Uncharacterized protein n=1 Tax=Cognatilysobacter bugurensis TaxID=543356 RepID=A0A918SZ43_9GAMM|nr:hypothetical protein GCM10007067_14490 [Lysobacter bugurensis]
MRARALDQAGTPRESGPVVSTTHLKASAMNLKKLLVGATLFATAFAAYAATTGCPLGCC